MTGCLASLIFPEAHIFEANDILPINHNAVLRFRDDSVSKVTGIPFKKVTVRKGIYVRGEYLQPNIMLANMYSKKVLGHTADRSIWNLDSVERYIAPANFQERLVNLVKSRIHLGQRLDYIPAETVISTIPITNTLRSAGIETSAEFTFQKIFTGRYKVPKCNVYQTLYYPDDDCCVYRATITGDDLIIESTAPVILADLEYVVHSFGVDYPSKIIESTVQDYGKIKNIDETERHRLLYELTTTHDVYSAGRFAIWKNVLMDDVLKDLYKIKELIYTTGYNRNKIGL